MTGKVGRPTPKVEVRVFKGGGQEGVYQESVAIKDVRG